MDGLLSRIAEATRRIVSRHKGRLWKKFITGPPNSALLARPRQRMAEDYFAKSFFRGARKVVDGVIPLAEAGTAFTHVPKCGGTSLHRWLAKEIGLVKLNSLPLLESATRSAVPLKHVSFGHLSIEAMLEKKLVTLGQLERLFCFSIVRNPYSRALSLFAHFQKINQLPETWSLNNFLLLLVRSRPMNGLFNLARFSQAAPQVSWLGGERWPGPDLLVQVEKPHELETTLAEKFGVRGTIPHSRQSHAEQFLHQWNSRTTRIVQDLYAADFQALGYDPDRLPF